MDDPVQDRIGQRRITDDLVPAVDRHLAGDDQRAGVVAVLDDLQQIALLFGEQRFRPPIVQDQQIDPGELVQQLGVPDARGGKRRKKRPFVGIAWDGPKPGRAGGGLGSRMGLAGKARSGAPGKTRTSNPQIRS